MAQEIIISQPEERRDILGCYSWRGYQVSPSSSRWPTYFPEILQRAGITPSTHPMAADLCAGDGSWAKILEENGWKAENITCIDLHKTPLPLVPKAKWRYWDLENLGQIILLGEQLPNPVLELQHHFDLVFSFLGPLHSNSEDAVCKFLVRPQGIIFNDNSPLRKMYSI